MTWNHHGLLGFSLVFALLGLAPVGAQAGADEPRSCAEKLADGENRLDVKINRAALENMFRGLRKFRPVVSQKNVLLVDYSKNSKVRRGYIIDVKNCDVLAHEYVAHGGTVYNPVMVRHGDPEHDGLLKKCVHADGTRTNMTRPGFYVTRGCHMTQKDFPLVSGVCGGVKIWGLEKRNDDAWTAGVVLHEHEGMFEGDEVKPEGQGCPIFAPGRLKDLLKYEIFQGALVYLYVPQCQ